MPPQKQEDTHWYIALVANNTELSTLNMLVARGEGYPADGPAEYSVPLIKKEKVNSRGKVITRDKPAIPGLLFVRTTNTVRYNLTRLNNIKRWMMSLTRGEGGRRNFATVSDSAMREFNDVINKINGACEIGNISDIVGKRIRFVGGPLKNEEGILEFSDGKYRFCRPIDDPNLPDLVITLETDTVKRYIEIIET